MYCNRGQTFPASNFGYKSFSMIEPSNFQALFNWLRIHAVVIAPEIFWVRGEHGFFVL